MRTQSKGWGGSIGRRVIVAMACVLILPGIGRAQTPEQQVVNDAAAALGGRDKVMAARTMALEGAGHEVAVTSLRYDALGYASAIAQIRDLKRAYDLANTRMRIEYTRQVQYAYFVGEAPATVVQALDGTVAFNPAATGNANRIFGNQANGRRLDYLRHPLTLVRAALGPNAKLSNSRMQEGDRLVDITIGDLPMLTLAINAQTKVPTRIMQMVDNTNMGDTLNTLEFRDYRAVNGLQLPTRISSRSDRWPSGDLRIYKVTVDGEVGDLAAPAAVAVAKQPPAAEPRSASNDAQEIARGVWFVTGTTHRSLIIEFSDHLAVFEAPNSERVTAVWARAKELRPNKPITTLIVTHHHADHTGGVRDAVARGVSEIIIHESNLNYINEMLKRPHTINPDMLAKQGNFKMPKITTIGDTGVVKDAAMTVNLYHMLDNSHADSMLMAFFPQGGILAQADAYMARDARHIIPGEPLGHAPWNRNVMSNVEHRKIKVEHMAPLHGDYVTWNDFVEDTITMTQYQPGQAPKPASGGAEAQ